MTKSDTGGSRTIGCEIIAALIKGPRTIGDIREMVDCSHVTVANWLRDLSAAGLVRISDYVQVPYEAANGPRAGSRYRAVYAWQIAPFALPDVTREDAEAA